LQLPKERVASPGLSGDAPAVPRQPPALHSQGAIRNELEAVLESPEFRGSHRGQMLLRYLVENALEGGLERLKERTIGVDLFHRDATYDTGQDAIVGGAASDLRKRLVAHYQHSDPAHAAANVRISLAPGSYIPDFEIPNPDSPAPAEVVVPPQPAPAPPAAMPRSRGWMHWAIIAGLAAICALLAVQIMTLRSASATPNRLAILPWSHIATPGGTVTLVAADSNFSFYKSLINADLSLPEYTSQRWLGDIAARVPTIPGLSLMPITSIGDVAVAGLVGSALRTGGCSISVRSGRMVQVDDFKSDRSVILLGSAYANPWVSLLNEHLNFHIEYDPATHKQVCMNASPRPGESPVYVGTARTPMPGVAYAIISLVRNLSHNGFVLIIAGTNMEGTEAAGELVTDLPRLSGALRIRGIDPTAKVEQLEILMRLDHLGTQSSRSEIIAHRVTP
jgi:hypothetical protein